MTKFRRKTVAEQYKNLMHHNENRNTTANPVTHKELSLPKRCTPTAIRNNTVIPVSFEPPLADDDTYVKNTIGQRRRQITPHQPNARKPRTILEISAIHPDRNANQTIIFSEYGASPVSSSILAIGVSV